MKTLFLRWLFNLLYPVARHSPYFKWDTYYADVGPFTVVSEDGAGTYVVGLWLFNKHLFTIVYDAWAFLMDEDEVAYFLADSATGV